MLVLPLYPRPGGNSVRDGRQAFSKMAEPVSSTRSSARRPSGDESGEPGRNHDLPYVGGVVADSLLSTTTHCRWNTRGTQISGLSGNGLRPEFGRGFVTRSTPARHRILRRRREGQCSANQSSDWSGRVRLDACRPTLKWNSTSGQSLRYDVETGEKNFRRWVPTGFVVARRR